MPPKLPMSDSVRWLNVRPREFLDFIGRARGRVDIDSGVAVGYGFSHCVK